MILVLLKTINKNTCLFKISQTQTPESEAKCGSKQEDTAQKLLEAYKTKYC
uniref:Uncharacterized protein n=1 Tax=Arion vulgaris TaxID=1028688 RepID=A0A0B7B1S1_9EUPU